MTSEDKEHEMTDFEKICDFENLLNAHKRSRRGKRNKIEVIQFEMNLAANLWQIKTELEAGTYQMKGYYNFTIYEPKKRCIYASFYQDRVIQHAIVGEVIQPIFSRRLIYDNVACQPGKGTHFAMKRLTKFMCEFNKKHGRQGYFLKCDIRSYFMNIDHAVLKRKIRKAIKDADVCRLLDHYIDSYEAEPGKGLPLGNQTSQWFAIYYMDTLDRLIKEKLKIKYYIRYMDDLLLIHESKEYLKECLEQIKLHVERDLKLELNQKTQLFPIKNGVEFVGFRFYMSDTGKIIKKMKAGSKKRMKRRLHKLRKDYESGEVDLNDVKQVVASYKGHLKHGHTYHLNKQVFQELVFQRSSEGGQNEEPQPNGGV